MTKRRASLQNLAFHVTKHIHMHVPRQATLHDYLEVHMYTIEIKLPSYDRASLAYRSKHAELQWLHKLELV